VEPREKGYGIESTSSTKIEGKRCQVGSRTLWGREIVSGVVKGAKDVGKPGQLF